MAFPKKPHQDCRSRFIDIIKSDSKNNQNLCASEKYIVKKILFRAAVPNVGHTLHRGAI